MGLLRFFLAFSVVNVHGHLLGFNLIYADIAVQSFFMISGFYMAMVLNEKYNRPDISYMDFILSRFFRIAPAYFLIFFLTVGSILIAWFGFSTELPPLRYWQEFYRQMSITTIISIVVTQFSLIGLDVTNFFTLGASGNLEFTYQFNREPIKLWRLLVVPQGWTLALEFYFYLLAPFIVKRSIKFMFGLIVISFTIRLSLVTLLDFQHDPWTYRFFPSELLFFLSGSLSYRLSKNLMVISLRSKKTIVGFCFLLIVLAGMIGRYGQLGGLLYLCSPVFMGILFLILPKLFAFTKSIKADRYIGELSYPLYISHTLVIWVSNSMMIRGSLEQRFVVATGSIIFAILIFELLDKRVDEFRHRKYS